MRTLKKLEVAPPFLAPTFIIFWLANSSIVLKGEDKLSTVKKAAKLAVYDDTIIRVKNHHVPATIRVDIALQILNKLYSLGKN